MAATNYTPIQLYYSTTASAAPTSGNLANGELAINITDGKLYYKDNSGVVQVIATKGAGSIGGSTTQIQYNNAGALAGNAAMTFNSGTNVTTLTTLNLTNALGATYGGTAQSAYTQGDILYSSATNTLSKLGIGTVNYILTSTGSVPQWVAPTSITVNTATNLAGGAAGSVPYQSGVATTTFLAIGVADRVMTSSGTAPQWVTSLTGLTGVSSSSITDTGLTSGRVTYASTGGLLADSTNLTFNGTTLSAGGFSTTGLSTLVQTVKIGDSNFSGVAVFAAATPAKLYIGTGTVTDTTSAIGATNATGAIASLAITPIAATNTSVTYTNAATLYIAGAPSAGTNVTLTNPYSLYVAAGAAYFGGTVTFASSIGALTVSSLTDTGLTSGRVTYAGTGGLLQDSANLTFNGTTLTANTLNLTNALGTAYGGTGLTSFTANGVVYASSTSALTTGSALTWNGSTFFANGTIQQGNGGAATIGKIWNDGGLYSVQADYTNVNGLKLDSPAYIAFTSNSAEQMRLTSTGLGIGTSSPAYKLDVNGVINGNNSIISRRASGAQPEFVLTQTSVASWSIYNPPSSTDLRFYNGSDLLTLTSAGNLGLGVAPNAWGSNYKAIEVSNGGGNVFGIVGNGTTGIGFNFYNNGTNDIYKFSVSAAKFQVSSSGQFQWYTAPSGTAGNPITFTQTMTLDASGNLLVNSTTANGKLYVSGAAANGVTARFEGSSNASNPLTQMITSDTTGNPYFTIYYTDSTSNRGSIQYNRGTGLMLYNTTSDYRAKDVYGPVVDSGAVIDSTPVYMGKMKGATQERPMFIAHETPEYAHTGEKDAVDKDGKPVYQQMDASALIPVMWAEIQSLRARLKAANI